MARLGGDMRDRGRKIVMKVIYRRGGGLKRNGRKRWHEVIQIVMEYSCTDATAEWLHCVANSFRLRVGWCVRVMYCGVMYVDARKF